MQLDSNSRKLPFADEATNRWPAPTLQRPQVRYDLDASFHRLYDTALAATQMPDRAMRRQRFYFLAQALRRLGAVPGEAAEIGCFRGLSAFIACTIFKEMGRDVLFHIFDSFEGLSEFTAPDQSPFLTTKQEGGAGLFACSQEQVRANLDAFPFVRLHKGWAPEGFEKVADSRFAYVHVDVDLYEPTRETIGFFWPRMSPGGIMVLDDFATVFFPGARMAAEELLAGRDDAMIVEAPAGSAVVVKLKA